MDENLQKQLEKADREEAEKLLDIHLWIECKIHEAQMSINDLNMRKERHRGAYNQEDWELLITKLKLVLEGLDSAMGLEKRLITYFD